MRTLLQHIESLEKKERINVASILGFKDPEKASVGDIVTLMSSHVGLELICGQCSSDEIAILQLLVNNDIHFRDIEHNLHMPVSRIETSAQSLCNKSIAYVLKNRQLLSNKLDKICMYAELRRIIQPINKQSLSQQYSELIKHLTSRKNQKQNIPSCSNAALRFLELCINRGYVVSVKYAIQTLGAMKAHTILNELISHNFINIFHIIASRFYGIIIVNPECINIPAEHIQDYIHNHYMALVAMLQTYDCITSKGLFITQEGNLRKSDIDTITKTLSTHSIHTLTKQLPPAIICKLALFLLSITDCLSVTSVNVNATLTSINKLLLTPHHIINVIIHNMGKEENPLFPNPFPTHNEIIKNMIRIIKKYTQCTAETYIYTFFLELLPSIIFDSEQNIDEFFDTTHTQCMCAINFLLSLGIIELDNNYIRLSDIGKTIYQPDKKLSTTPVKAVYINPDFSLIIPYHELPSDISYTILSFTQITSSDVTIHAKISKISILNAIKRGMNPDVFISVLKQYCKNQLPQNIRFQLNEWIERTPRIMIHKGIILHSSKKEFIDELSLKFTKGVIAERISDHYIMIHESALDTVIKFAKKKDVVLTINLQME